MEKRQQEEIMHSSTIMFSSKIAKLKPINHFKVICLTHLIKKWHSIRIKVFEIHYIQCLNYFWFFIFFKLIMHKNHHLSLSDEQ